VISACPGPRFQALNLNGSARTLAKPSRFSFATAHATAEAADELAVVERDSAGAVSSGTDLVPFLADMKQVFQRLRDEAALQDTDYDPPFSDFNLVIDNHGAAVNVTVPKSTVRIKFRYSAKLDPQPIVRTVHDSAQRCDIQVDERREGFPPELPPDHPFVRACVETAGQQPGTAAFGTDASELQALAPCVVLGPGDIAEAHTPTEKVRLADLHAAVPVFMRLAERMAAE